MGVIELLFLMVFTLLIGTKPWSNIMEILEEKDGVDTELLVYAMTLVNKVGWIVPPQKIGVKALNPMTRVCSH